MMREVFGITWLTVALVAASSAQHAPLESTIENNLLNPVDQESHDDEDLDEAVHDYNETIEAGKTESNQVNDTEWEIIVTTVQTEDIEHQNTETVATTTSDLIQIDDNDDQAGETETTITSSSTITSDTIAESETESVTANDPNYEDNTTESNLPNSTNSGESEEHKETVSVKEPDYNVTLDPDNDLSRSIENIADTYVVQTTTGPVMGQQWNENTNIISYIDIPYGVFSGLFQAPEPPAPWDTVHQQSEHTKRCPQLQDDLYVGDEDCLTLSIFKPLDAENASVLFYIHDGNFASGSGDAAIYGPKYLVSKGIILVLPNYRLGPLGFLCLQNDKIPGNAGLKDLALALNWTKENIEAFGGNPSNIIVSGDGTSGALAGYLALSKKSKDYISRVIMDSGSVLSYLMFDRHPHIAAEKLASKLGENESLELVNVTTLILAADDIEFKPCIEKTDDAFMDQTPWTMINNANIDTTFIIGSAMYAGTHVALQQTSESIQLWNEDYGLLLPNDLIFEDNAERIRLGEKIKTEYFGEDAINLTDVENLALYLTDAAYLSPIIRTARLLVKAGATVYLYEFSFAGDLNRELDSLNRPVEGAVKGDIVSYLFTQDGQDVMEGSDEELMVNALVELWFNFINTATPSSENTQWNQLRETNECEEEWLFIDTEIEMRQGLHVNRLKLWTEIYEAHFIEHNLASETSPRVLTVLVIQIVFWLGFCRNVSHLY